MTDGTEIDRRTMLAQLAVGLAVTQFPLSRAFAGEAQGSAEDWAKLDRRLGPLKNLNGYFPFKVPATPEAWAKRAEELRRQLLVATGLWPMPTKPPLQPTIHGIVERDDFTVEKVYFESSPGLYVTGSLFRPKGVAGKRPTILCPHGHWNNGRFFDHGEEGVKKEIQAGGEKYPTSGRYPLQARCAQLARMGCVVFHYDMLGYADNVPIPQAIGHGFRKQRPHLSRPDHFGLFSAQAELRLLSPMGLQTWNSVRALDFVLGLPDVDTARIGVTGASGGGTQTFILTAIDDRVAAAFPAVMVSTAMQGGCTCENCSYLRVETGNIEIAALCAPRPLGMTAADDWTKEIETKGLPELKKLYAMLGAPDKVEGKYYHFPHNYNYVSRAMMYEFFNKHLGLGQKSPILEPDFKPLSVAELTVWDDKHPKPTMDEDAEVAVLRALANDSDKQVAALTPHDSASLEKFRKIVGGGWRVLIGRGLPHNVEAPADRSATVALSGSAAIRAQRGLLRKGSPDEVVAFLHLQPEKPSGHTVLWVDSKGKESILSGEAVAEPVLDLLKAGFSIFAIDLLGASKYAAKSRAIENGREAACFTFGYNHPRFAQRVHDILSSVAYLSKGMNQRTKIDMVGLGGAGAYVTAAAVAADGSNRVGRLVVDTAGFRFGQITDIEDPRLLPGAVKYGDVAALLGLCAPQEMLLLGEGSAPPDVTKACYKAAGTPENVAANRSDAAAGPQAAVKWLLG